MYLRECRGDKEDCKKLFFTTQSNKQYCDSKCRYNSILESNRKSRKKYYKRNKKKSILSQIGTTTLSKHPNPDFEREKTIVENEKKRTFHTTKYKKGLTNNYAWIDNCKTMEYGENQPIGIQQTHNYASFDDYYQFSISLFLSETPPCPECGATTQCKDLKRLDVCCTNPKCGLVIKAPILHNGFTLPELPAHKQLFSHEYKEKKRIYEQAKGEGSDEGGM